jgi:HEAT repeat protein
MKEIEQLIERYKDGEPSISMEEIIVMANMKQLETLEKILSALTTEN